MFTYQGQMKTQRKGLKSTKSNVTTSAQKSLDFFLPSDRPNVKTNQACYAIVDLNSLTTACMDLPGRFPKRSSSSNQRLLVRYHCDANCTRGMPIEIRKGQAMTNAWQELHSMFSKTGVVPETMVLDNEFSVEIKTAFDEHKLP